MIDGRFDQHFLEIFAKGDTKRQAEPAAVALSLVLLALAALLLG